MVPKKLCLGVPCVRDCGFRAREVREIAVHAGVANRLGTTVVSVER